MQKKARKKTRIAIKWKQSPINQKLSKERLSLTSGYPGYLSLIRTKVGYENCSEVDLIQLENLWKNLEQFPAFSNASVALFFWLSSDYISIWISSWPIVLLNSCILASTTVTVGVPHIGAHLILMIKPCWKWRGIRLLSRTVVFAGGLWCTWGHISATPHIRCLHYNS